MRNEAIRSSQIDALRTVFPSSQTAEPKASFGDELKNSLEQVVSLQHRQAGRNHGHYGGVEQIHETMIKMEEAEISLRLLTKSGPRSWMPIRKSCDAVLGARFIVQHGSFQQHLSAAMTNMSSHEPVTG